MVGSHAKQRTAISRSDENRRTRAGHDISETRLDTAPPFCPPLPFMPQAAVIIPARWESTRFPGKPLHVIAGKPLVQHVWERCREARGIERIIVATDDARIAEAATAFGAEVAMTSPTHQSGTDRIAEAAATLAGVTHVVNVQGDEPLIDGALITELAETLLAEPDLDMITAAHEIDDPADVQN